MSGIYAIVNTVNGKRYIGHAADVRGRYAYHCCQLRSGRHHCPPLQNAWRKYGAAAFRFEMLEEVSGRAEMIACEQKWLDHSWRDTLYNVARIAAAPNAGRKFGPEVAQKRLRSMRGWRHSPESKARIAAALKGLKRTSEQVEHLRGRRLSTEARARIGAANQRHLSGREQSSDHIAKRAAALRGRKRPDLSATMLGNTRCVGRILSDETKAKMAAASRAAWVRRRERMQET